MDKIKQNHYYIFGGVRCENMKEACERFNLTSRQFSHLVKRGAIQKHY